MPVILIVEDEWLIARDFSDFLRDAGFEILGPYPAVEAALAVIRDRPIDAALLDMELRDGKSFPLAEILRQGGIPFAFVSGHAASELPAALQAERLLAKPIERAALVAAVRAMCDARDQTPAPSAGA